ncbi:MAG: ribosome silencing factor [Cyanobacteria bacterium SIG31]|nr:ribosome silencing factor [Cyanobacteria bacterium SIG31]
MTKDLTSYKLACVVARFLDEKIAKDISILNISNVSSFADYFVICSAQSNTQVKALTENLADKVKQTFSRLPHGKENDAKNRWNLIDYGDVVVHILHQEDREAYAIEKFWNHAFSIPKETWLKESEEFSEYK